MGEIFQNASIANIRQLVHQLKSPKALNEAKSNPVKFFAQYGIELPANIEYEFHFDTDKVLYFVLPLPSGMALTDEQMFEINASKNYCAGTVFCTASTLGSLSCPADTLGCILLSTVSTASSASSKASR